MRRRLAGGAAVVAVGLAAFVCLLGALWEADSAGRDGRNESGGSASVVSRAVDEYVDWNGNLAGDGMSRGQTEVVPEFPARDDLQDRMSRSQAGDGVQERMLEFQAGDDVREQVPELPTQYDLRDRFPWLAAPDQGSFATCWAFAALKALETSVEEPVSFAVDHMSLRNSFGLGQEEGGSDAISSAYLLAWQGPVSGVEDPYGDGRTVVEAEPLYHVQEIQFLTGGDLEAIKRAIYDVGGVQSSLYVQEETGAVRAGFYNEETSSYFYSGEEKPNHEVLIVGWDDSCPKEWFVQEPEHDGAFLCMNTWGEGFGSSGFFYVSYEDSWIAEHCVVYTGVEENDNYDRVFQTDLCGWTGQIGYGDSKAWFGNIYEAEETLELAAAGFYATAPGSECRVYVVAGDVAEADGSVREVGANLEADGDAWMPGAVAGCRKVVTGVRMEYAGYYTVPFDVPVSVEEGERFCVMVEIDSPGTVEPVAIEYQTGERTAKVDIGDGEGYISLDGVNWERTEMEYACNVCLKVYANVVK